MKGGADVQVYYDLHLHSCLSPCGDNDMTPYNLVNMAALQGLQMIALTDHNSCLNCPAAMEAGARAGVLVIPGMELCTAEEAHIVCLFPALLQALSFSEYVKKHIPPIGNRPEIFGEQRVMDAEDGISGTEETLLTTASEIRVDRVTQLVRTYGGVCFPAHLDRPSYSVLSSLGAFEAEWGFSAAELTRAADIAGYTAKYPALEGMPLLCNSDAHYLENIPEAAAWLELEDCTIPALFAVLDGSRPCAWSRGLAD